MGVRRILVRKILIIILLINILTYFFSPYLVTYANTKDFSVTNDSLFKSRLTQLLKKCLKYNSQNNSQKTNLGAIYNRQIIVKIKSGNDFNINKFSAYITNNNFRLSKQHGYLILKVPENQDYQKFLLELQNNSSVEFAEPDYIFRIDSAPNDPYYLAQWHLSKIGMPDVWQSFTETNQTTIAVIDTGVDYNHEDLKGKVILGKDFVNNDNVPIDDNGHGTHVAGIIAAITNNGIGIAGITQKVKILAIKAADRKGIFTLSNVLEAIFYAISQKVDVINLSFGGYMYQGIPILSLMDAIYQAYKTGIVVVAAAGNDSSDEWTFPAAVWCAIAVSATGTNDNLADFSNYGEYIDISAPGVNILSTVPYELDQDSKKDGYTHYSGTSMSAPIISAAAAFLKSIHPDWDPDKIEWALELSAARKDSNILWNKYTGYGRVNLFNAIRTTLPDTSQDMGNTTQTAQRIECNQTITQKIDMPGDEDLFTFDVQTTSNVLIQISDVPSNLDIVGVLYRFDNNTLNKIYEIDENGIGSNEEVTLKLNPGRYYLKIYDLFNHWATNPYKLSVDIQPVSNTPYKMGFAVTNKIVFEITLKEDIALKSVELLDNGNVIATTDDIKGTVATMVYKGEFNKTDYQIRVWSADGRYGLAPVKIKQSLAIIAKDTSAGVLTIMANVNGKLYKNSVYIKDMNKDEIYTIGNINLGDVIELVPDQEDCVTTQFITTN